MHIKVVRKIQCPSLWKAVQIINAMCKSVKKILAQTNNVKVVIFTRYTFCF